MSTAIESMRSGYGEIFSAPLRDPSIWWLLAPILIIWFVSEIYFGRYKKERPGWNTALGDGMSLLWIVLTSLKLIFTEHFDLFSWGKFFFVLLLGLYAAMVVFFAFTHRIKQRILLTLAEPSFVYYLSMISVLYINDLISMNFWMIVDIILLFAILLIAEKVIRSLIPEAIEEMQHHSAEHVEKRHYPLYPVPHHIAQQRHPVNQHWQLRRF